MNTPAARLDGLGTTIFSRMSELASRTASVNLGQGFPDWDASPAIIDAATEAMRTGQNQYAPGRGVAPLRQAIADHQLRFYGVQLDPDSQVVVTTGATEAIAAALLGLVDPGDEVLVFEPYFDSYVAMIQIAGGVRRPVTLRAPDYRLDVEEFEAAVSERTKIILLNSPHNPTGTVFNEQELREIARIAVERDLIVISDEVYEHLVFDGTRHLPIATLPGMRERTLTISSAGKTFSVTGWKVGWAVGPAALVDAVAGVQQFLTYSSGTPLQLAVAQALASSDDYFDAVAANLQARRDQLCDGLEAIGFEVHRPGGTYFATTDIRSLGYSDGLEFCLDLPERCGVVAIPHQVFYDHTEIGKPLVRWAFCKRASVIDEALERLAGLGRY